LADAIGDHKFAGPGMSAIVVFSKGHLGVILRMGLTPERDHYQPEPLVRAVLDATR
jgi:hypothetical protein